LPKLEAAGCVPAVFVSVAEFDGRRRHWRQDL